VSGPERIELTVNGVPRTTDVEPRTTLADLLRNGFGLTGTHLGCEQGICGACTVLVDGSSARACTMLAVQARDSRIWTIEGLSPPEGLSPLQQSFRQHHGLQCGFCTPGLVVAATELLARSAAGLTEREVRQEIGGNICRCTGYDSIVDAVLAIAPSSVVDLPGAGEVSVSYAPAEVSSVPEPINASPAGASVGAAQDRGTAAAPVLREAALAAATLAAAFGVGVLSARVVRRLVRPLGAVGQTRR
jgi:aerobic-type carbon monoxide dehydrogenase small subunit (CoxS/CutS family)